MLENPNFNFDFNENACKNCGGKCCTIKAGQKGYIWLNNQEISIIADFLQISKIDLIEKFLYKINNEFSAKLKQYNDGAACIFFDEKHKNCSIYEVRPKQCKTFPFWSHYKDDFSELCKECEGVLPKKDKNS